jgi:hypothetical protein
MPFPISDAHSLALERRRCAVVALGFLLLPHQRVHPKTRLRMAFPALGVTKSGIVLTSPVLYLSNHTAGDHQEATSPLRTHHQDADVF